MKYNEVGVVKRRGVLGAACFRRYKARSFPTKRYLCSIDTEKRLQQRVSLTRSEV